MKHSRSRKKFNLALSVVNKLRHISRVDLILALVVLGLTAFGVIMVFNTSVVVAYEQFGDKYWFFKNQLIWAVVGIVLAAFFAVTNYRFWLKISGWGIVVSVFLLILVMIPGFSPEVYGARQRLIIPGIPFLAQLTFQPSEIAKFAVVLYSSAIFSTWLEKKKMLPHKQFLGILALVLFFTAVEPDLGNAILIAGSATAVYFAAGAPLLWLIGIGGLGGLGAFLYAFSAEYRRERILTFLNPLEGTDSTAYHIRQIFIALGSGGLFGLGLGNSRQKYQYIPEVTTDSIFAVIGEELGLIGVIVLVCALGFVIWRGYDIAKNASDNFGRFLAIGLTTNIAIQAIVNLGGMVGIMPLTGVPLPFISYGGSSLTLLLLSVGMLLSISRAKT